MATRTKPLARRPTSSRVVLSRVFRGKFVEALRRAYVRGELDLGGASATLRTPACWHAFVDALFHTDWVVYAKPAFGGSEAVLRYLGRYTHRVAISNHRLIAFDGERVTFHWKDYAHEGQRRTMTLTAMQFLRRFVQHVLPRGFVRIRQFGYLANHCRTARLALARRLLRRVPPPADSLSTTPRWYCPRCGGPMVLGPNLTARQLAWVCLGFESAHTKCCMIWAAVHEVKHDSAAGLSCLTVKLCKVAQAVY